MSGYSWLVQAFSVTFAMQSFATHDAHNVVCLNLVGILEMGPDTRFLDEQRRIWKGHMPVRWNVSAD